MIRRRSTNRQSATTSPSRAFTVPSTSASTSVPPVVVDAQAERPLDVDRDPGRVALDDQLAVGRHERAARAGPSGSLLAQPVTAGARAAARRRRRR